MSYEIEFISLSCLDAQEITDRPYLKVNGDIEWGPTVMRTGETRTIDRHVSFDDDIRVELWDSDRNTVPHRRDDHFGTMQLSEHEVRGITSGDHHLLTHTFHRDSGIVGDARYTLTYDLHSTWAKIGIEWVKEYHGRARNLSNTQQQAEGFYNELTGTRSFNWGDDYAWDQDFEEQGVGSPATGTDTTWIDSVHIAFFSGHGGPTGPLFGVAGHDSGRAHHDEIRWGNESLNWIAFDACELLRESGVFDRWRDAFEGLHIILGFHTTCGDESNRGRYFAEYLNDGYTVIEAWKKACKETESSGTEWAYLRSGGGNGVNTYDDHWYGKGWVSPDPTNTWRAYSRGSC